jgi:ribosomal protein L16/L10AE
MITESDPIGVRMTYYLLPTTEVRVEQLHHVALPEAHRLVTRILATATAPPHVDAVLFDEHPHRINPAAAAGRMQRDAAGVGVRPVWIQAVLIDQVPGERTSARRE